MLTPEERALLIEQQDRLIELLVLKQEASEAEDWDRCFMSAGILTPVRPHRRKARDALSMMRVRTSAL